MTDPNKQSDDFAADLYINPLIGQSSSLTAELYKQLAMATETNMSTKTATQAEQVAEIFNNDGQVFCTADGVELADAIKTHGGWREAYGSDVARYEFDDGSSIVVCGAAWDFGRWTLKQIEELTIENLAKLAAESNEHEYEAITSDDEHERDAAADRLRYLAVYTWKG